MYGSVVGHSVMKFSLDSILNTRSLLDEKYTNGRVDFRL